MRQVVVAAAALAINFGVCVQAHADQNQLERYFGYSAGIVSPDSTRPVNSGIAGSATWGWPLSPQLAAEFSMGGVLFDMEDASADKAGIYHAKGNLIFTISDTAFTSNSAATFLSLSAGAQHDENGPNTSTAARLGGGAGVLLPLFGEHTRLRLEAEYVYVASSELYASTDSLSDFVISVGVQFDLGDRANSRDCNQCDSDADGVADAVDYCPATIFNAPVDERGCVGDADSDGVNDVDDRCFGTAKGVHVDLWGCPPDADKDGVPDQFDECKNTAPNQTVNILGCFVDTDGDGLANLEDNCPDTFKGAKIDTSGCEIDTDADGVVDRLDRCANSPVGVQIDIGGCQLDSDADGIADSLDQCPDEAAAEIDAVGCPVEYVAEPQPVIAIPVPQDLVIHTAEPLEATEQKAIFVDKAIQFSQASADLLKSAKPSLDKIVTRMNEDKTLEYEIRGHTDGQGSSMFNQTLSVARAHAVRDYLKDKGISGWRILATGVGAKEPIASDETEEGRAENRRVEFRVRGGE